MSSGKLIKNNKFANYKYHVEKKFEAGVVLKGKDVKAIRANKFEIRDSFVKEEKGELFLWNTLFFDEPDSIQKRKLLLNRREIEKIKTILKDKKRHGFVLSVRYNEKNLVKLDIGFGIVKKARDKKASEKRASEKRNLEKVMREE